MEGCRREASALQRRVEGEEERAETLQAELVQQQRLSQLLQGRMQVLETVSETRVPPQEVSRLQVQQCALVRNRLQVPVVCCDG